MSKKLTNEGIDIKLSQIQFNKLEHICKMGYIIHDKLDDEINEMVKLGLLNKSHWQSDDHSAIYRPTYDGYRYIDTKRKKNIYGKQKFKPKQHVLCIRKGYTKQEFCVVEEVFQLDALCTNKDNIQCKENIYLVRCFDANRGIVFEKILESNMEAYY